MSKLPFWEEKPLDKLSQSEWESLCDGCAKCCTISLEDIDSGELVSTCIACKCLDLDSCRCNSYQQRSELVPDCIILTPNNLGDYAWMPQTCAYRLLNEGKQLADWHPLISGNANSVHTTGHSVKGTLVSEYDVHPDELVNFVLEKKL